jgi:DNA polymerase-1
METLLIVDGNAIIHRAYHALPAFKTKDGVPTNALYGFVTMLHTAISEFKATHVIICFDTAAKTFRDEMFPEYRSHRPQTEDDLIKQFPMVREFLNAAGIEYVEKDGFEADDLIATIATKLKESNIVKLIFTGDKDILQLVNMEKSTLVISPQNGSAKPLVYDDKAVEKRFNIKPHFIADFKALAGDPSDNYKGVAGIGQKTAANLINQFGAVEKLYDHIDEIENTKLREKLISGKENAILSKKLAQLDCNVAISIDLEKFRFNSYNEKLKDFFDEYQFKSIKNRLFNEAGTSKIAKKVEEKKETKNKNQLGLF